jgi:diguanylate cyclase (GGDEF)-like protein
MNDNKKILSIIAMMMFAFAFLIIVVLVVNFRKFSQSREFNKAHIIASLVEDGLTAHMVSGTMAQREFFLTNAKDSSGALKIWLFRTKKVTELFGEGFSNEAIRDDIDKKAIQTAKPQTIIDEKLANSTLRITIPYIATKEQNPNCLTCHGNVKEGEVLGGISMVFNIDEARNEAMITILKIAGITILFMILFLYITNRFLKPYTSILVYIKESLQKASLGDYSSRIDIKSKDKAFEVARWLNTLLEKLEETIGSIESSISLFVADRREKFSDPLEKSKSVVEDIAMIYKFKRTIEQDASKDIIYQRLIKVFKDELHVSDVSLYEIDKKSDKRVLIYDDTPDKFCNIADDNPSKKCRAYRTNSVVISDEFPEICRACKSTKEYLCINYNIDKNVSLVLNIKPENKEELYENKKAIGYIKNYLESARPVLQSKILTEILQKSNMIDGLTGLYNRKYLDIFMDKNAKKYNSFGVAMVDIDYFKKVNDNYGHDVGDRVLKGLSEVFKSTIEMEKDIVFRFGGEEFLIFIPDTNSAKNKIQNIKDKFEEMIFNAQSESFNKTLSAGVSFYKDDSEHIWQVIKNADIALYEAKNSGRNKIVFYKDMEKKAK